MEYSSSYEELLLARAWGGTGVVKFSKLSEVPDQRKPTELQIGGSWVQFLPLIQGSDSQGMNYSLDFDISQAVKAWNILLHTCISFDNDCYY